MIKESVISITDCEIEELVEKTYPSIVEYSFVATQECGNDSEHRFEVKSIAPLPAYDAVTLESIKAGIVPTFSNYVIFQDLVNQAILEPGIYIVRVSW